VNTILETG